MQTIPITQIVIPQHRKTRGNIEQLANSIRDLGLLNPITLTTSYHLIAGYHRYLACQSLGWRDIPANIVTLDALHAELAEIDENLQRQELTVLERAEQLARRKNIYEEVYPQTKNGGDRVSDKAKKQMADSAIWSFNKDTAAKTKISERAIREDIQIANDIAPDVKEAIRDTDLADRKTDLLKLSQMSTGEQRKFIEQYIPSLNSDKPATPYFRANFSGDNEWYTPAQYVELARTVFGAIDLDPASNERAQKVVKATTYFDASTNGLAQKWSGRIWLNPPYSQPEIMQFIQKLIDELPNIDEAILLTHNYTDTAWFHLAAKNAPAICFTRGRIKFYNQNGEGCAPTQGQAFFYYGKNKERFAEVFKEVGFIR
jgi:ParB family chromosome partitioning protein